jgi:hypothetical protein
MKFLLLGAAIAVLLSAPSQAASFLNAGFESGDLSGWSHSGGDVEVVTDADDALADPIFGQHYTATEGRYFAKLVAGPVEGDYTRLFQPFKLGVKSRVSFNAAFLAFDYDEYNDDAYVRIISLGKSQIIFASSVAAVGNQGHTDWLSFTSDELDVGDYILEAGVRNVGVPDPTYSSQLLLDNVAVAVPEPGAWTLMIVGFGAIGSALRARRRPASLNLRGA